MALTLDLGRRIELVSMDSRFHDISIALYRQEQDGRPVLVVHSYSGLDGVSERVDFVGHAMTVLGGVVGNGQQIRFPCGDTHEFAARRLFIEACKLDPSVDVTARPLTVFDKKSNAEVTVASLGEGVYRLTGDGYDEKSVKRRLAIGAGLVKLGQMGWVEGDQERFAFRCGHSHDRLVGLLLTRALNARGVEREEQMAAARGQLLAPSAQK
jgi:hypothetical protein